MHRRTPCAQSHTLLQQILTPCLLCKPQRQIQTCDASNENWYWLSIVVHNQYWCLTRSMNWMPKDCRSWCAELSPCLLACHCCLRVPKRGLGSTACALIRIYMMCMKAQIASPVRPRQLPCWEPAAWANRRSSMLCPATMGKQLGRYGKATSAVVTPLRQPNSCAS